MVTTRSGAGTGGKIVTNRRKWRLAATPYDRPPPPPQQPPVKSPNWFTGRVVPSVRAIASGATKILASIFSDSESSSSEDEDSAFEDGVDNDIEFETRDGDDALAEFGQETRSSVRRTETKGLIEQLIMQETFSRDECDKLVKVLDSRVIDWSLAAGGPSNHEDVDIYSKAVVEAKKWFQEKNVGSSSLTELGHQSFHLNSKGPEHQAGSDGGSPVDVARSYMKDRPAWASPVKHMELRTPLTSTRNFFNEGTPYPVGRSSLSSAKKPGSLSAGSWNIQEELRRVREKATEDMLCTPSTIFDPSWFAVAPSSKESAGAGKVAMEERTTEPGSLSKSKPVEGLVDAGISSDPALAVLESREDSKPSLAHQATSVSGNEKDSEAVKMDAETLTTDFTQHYSPNHGDHGTQSINGHSSSQASLSAGEATAQNDKQHDSENHIADTVMEKNVAVTNVEGGVLEGDCTLLSEAAVEVPIVSETDSIATSSQNSLGMPHEELSLDKGKQPVRKPGKTTRRGRGRGK